MDAMSIKIPYKKVKQEVELVGVDEEELRRLQIGGGSILSSTTTSLTPTTSSVSSSSNGDVQGPHPHLRHQDEPLQQHSSLLTLILSCTIAAGVQFGWALQLSLLTPYIQTLGIGHAFSSFIWLCGPITGLVVQPCVGIWSDKCTSKYGRRRPFIFVGSLMISVATLDTFWGILQSIAALLKVLVLKQLFFLLSGSGCWTLQIIQCRWFPFLMSRACCEPCGNLKAAFLIAVIFLTICTCVTLYFADEVPLTPKEPSRLTDSAPLLAFPQQIGFDLSESKTDKLLTDNASKDKSESDFVTANYMKNEDKKVEEDQDESFSDGTGAVLANLLISLRHLPPAMCSVLIVMALTSLSWFPFFLFETDWMGREVYRGDLKGDASKVQAYHQGVREGAFGLLLNSVILGISSFFIEPMCRWMGGRMVWAMSSFIVFACMAGTAIISLVSLREYPQGIENDIGANGATKIAALTLFSLLGLPLAVTYSVPFSVTAELTADSGGGQGLAAGVLNLAVVIPQMIVSLGAGPWDALFGGGNIPAFILASLSALAAGIIAILKLPKLSSSSYRTTGLHFG